MKPPYEDDSEIIEATQQWIEQVVIRYQFCPFAAQPFRDKNIRYRIVQRDELIRLESLFLSECALLNAHTNPETTLLIFKKGLKDFYDYLNILADCEDLLEKHNYTGVYQLASFHPHYQFAGTPPDDITNRTNQSPYPVIQLLRESSITSALENYPNPEEIPERNIEKAREIWG